MASEVFSYRLLEEPGPALQLWVHLTVHENPSIEILLRIVAQPFIFPQDPLEHGVNFVEVFVTCVLVSIYFILH